ncbi:PEP-CTERM sorting domain-containing protein [Xylophilus sp. Kf1]|nr:PEP-CTERM sorting domain-containing protein [Xylophilus sp. Kf1]
MREIFQTSSYNPGVLLLIMQVLAYLKNSDNRAADNAPNKHRFRSPLCRSDFLEGIPVKKMLAPLIPLAMIFSAAPMAADAAVLDLTTFSRTVGTNSQITVTPVLATLLGSAAISAQVSRLASFEWKFNAGDFYLPSVGLNDYAYLTTSAGTVELSDVATVGVQGQSGWVRYLFTQPYSGNIILGVQNRFDDEDASQLQLRQLITTPSVPEPASHALLLAGMGLVGVVARRIGRRRATI